MIISRLIVIIYFALSIWFTLLSYFALGFSDLQGVFYCLLFLLPSLLFLLKIEPELKGNLVINYLLLLLITLQSLVLIFEFEALDLVDPEIISITFVTVCFLQVMLLLMELNNRKKVY